MRSEPLCIARNKCSSRGNFVINELIPWTASLMLSGSLFIILLMLLQNARCCHRKILWQLGDIYKRLLLLFLRVSLFDWSILNSFLHQFALFSSPRQKYSVPIRLYVFTMAWGSLYPSIRQAYFQDFRESLTCNYSIYYRLTNYEQCNLIIVTRPEFNTQ